MIFIFFEDMIQFFGSNIKYFLSMLNFLCESNVSRCQSRTGNYAIINDLVSFEKEYNYFFINFSGLQQKFFWFLSYLIQQSLICKIFRAIHPVWIQKLKQPVIYIKVMTENWACCGFQGWLQTKNGDLPRRSTHIIISYIMW